MNHEAQIEKSFIDVLTQRENLGSSKRGQQERCKGVVVLQP